VKESVHFESSEEELCKFCPQILEFIQTNKITLLYGQMGAGKTALMRAICKELDCSSEK
jgi:tRNA A37 threonylcarbamoyladenosine biosynthesis protein TsaE